MKNKYIIVLMLTVFFASCTKNFEDFNTDKKQPAVVEGEMLFSNALKNLADQLTTPNVNLNIFNLWAQYWTETTYTDEANYDIVNRTIADNTFRVFYRDILRDLSEAKRLIAMEEVTIVNRQEDIDNKLLIIDLLQSYCYEILVDIFGNVPYSEAIDIENLSPKYDDAATIYSDLIDRVKSDVSSLSGSSNLSADFVYGGDVDAWKKFGNSLLIKLGITIADANDGLAKSTIEGAYANAFDSHADDALYPYLGASPNANQIYAELVLTGRKDFVGANTLIDKMNDLADPRRAAYFTMIGGAYVGGEYGESSPYSQYSHVAPAIQDPTFPGFLLTYDQQLFYLAEAAARGYNVGSTADQLYSDAITSSFELWGVENAASYIAQSDVAYDAASWRDLIGTQSWIAFYVRGLEGYTQWRRLDAPAFNIAPTISSVDEIPVRFTYPINEQTLNKDSFESASEAIGGDDLTTKIFWDKN
jgi:hypothetical protein